MQWYRSSTVTVTNGSATVTGASTLWSDVGTLNPGDIFNGPDGKLYEILTINSNTGITLNSVYLGTSLSGQAYSIMPIGLLPSTLAQQVKTTLATANAALASTVRYDISTMGLSLTQQQNARTNIAALSALDVGQGRLSKSVAGGVDVTLTAAEASNQFIELTGAITANINVIVPAAARLFYIANLTSGAFTVMVKTPSGTGVAVATGDRMAVECDATNIVNPTLGKGTFTTLSATGVCVANSYYGTSSGTYLFADNSGANAFVVNGSTSGVPNTLQYKSNGVIQATLDASGNLGLGVVPSAWNAAFRAMQISNFGIMVSNAGNTYQLSNAYFDGSYKYLSTNYSAKYEMVAGQHAWYNAPSGTAGNTVTFTQAMTLDASGNLNIAGSMIDYGSNYKGINLQGAHVRSNGPLTLQVATNVAGTNSVPLYNQSTGAAIYTQSIGTHTWYTAPIGTAGTPITFTSSLAVSKGTTLTLEGANSTAGTGIAFPATQSASTDANTLDDYEEGTFTPVIVGLTTAGVGAYTSTTGKYTKVGNLVTISIYLVVTAHTGTGGMSVSGLPFIVQAVYQPCSFRVNNLSLTASNIIQGYANAGASTISLEQVPSGGGTITSIPMDTACEIMLSCSYFTS